MKLPVLRAAPLYAPRFVDRGERRDDVVIAAELRQRQLDAGAGGLVRLEEDEFVFVTDNHFGG